jgi:hypothetical protein
VLFIYHSMWTLICINSLCPGKQFAEANIWLATATVVAALQIEKAKDDTGNFITPDAAFTDGLSRCLGISGGVSVSGMSAAVVASDRVHILINPVTWVTARSDSLRPRSDSFITAVTRQPQYACQACTRLALIQALSTVLLVDAGS